MVQIIPGPGKELAAAAESFAQGLEKYMKPDHEFQIAMQKAIGTNPQLAQNLADLEYNAPGTLDRMGFGNLGKVISQVPESAESTVQRTARGEIVEGAKAKVKLGNEQTGFDLSRLNETIHFLKDPQNKAVTADMILKKLTGQTTGERDETLARTDEIKARTAGVKTENEVAAAEAPTKIAKAGVARKAYDDALKNAPELAKTDFLRVARDFMTGKADGATVSALFNTPGAQEALSKAIQSVEEERQIALREHLEAMRETRADKSSEALTTREAFSRYQATKGAGTLDAWRTILTDPHKADEIRKKDPEKLTQDEKDILHAATAQDQLQDMQSIGEVRALNGGIRTALRDLEEAQKKNDGPAAMQTYIDNLNNMLDQKAIASGKNITAKYGPRPSIGESEAGTLTKHPMLSLGMGSEGTGLYYVGEDGKRIRDDEVFSEPKVGLGKLSANALRAYTEIQGTPQAQHAAALENLKKANPKLYDEVKSFIK